MKYHLMNKNLLIGKFELVERYGNEIATGVELYKITPFELGMYTSGWNIVKQLSIVSI